MKITVEMAGTKMGNDTITEAFKTGIYCFRFDLQDDNDLSRHVFILTGEEKQELIKKIISTTEGIDKIKNNMKIVI